MPYIASIDQGTTSSRCIIFDEKFTILSAHQLFHKQITPRPGWLEHDPEEIYSNCCLCLAEALKKLRSKDPKFEKVSAIGITNQRETGVAWDRKTGKPLCNAIVWSDARTYEVSNRIAKECGGGDRNFAANITGLPVSTYFTAFKFRWMLENVPAVAAARKSGSLLLGTIETWLLWKLSEGKVFLTDVSNASRTFLMNLRTQQWCDKLCQELDIPLAALPEIRSNSERYCDVVANDHGIRDALGVPTPVTGCIGDQQSALFGHIGLHKGDAKNTYGTGCFMLMNVGTEPQFSKHGLLGTIAYKLGTEPTKFALEGSVAGAGATVEWMRSNLGFFDHPMQMESIARKVGGTDGVVFVPAFGGLLAPYWDPTARGTLVGMTYKTNKSHIIRAALEAISMQVNAVMLAMKEDSGVEMNCLRVDGGLTRSRLLMEMQADILGVNLYVPHLTETTALGAALCAGLAVGVWKSVEEMQKTAKEHLSGETVNPITTDEQVRKARLEAWNAAVKLSRWAKL
ncbi:putative glycerol kinase, glycosomal [Leishmania major strain Friedlin]|uniref:glycerol kinase n=1 Tax=Leishmania major TaxID=5664 RepID=E9AFD2_LEIMA|nr:putative glycerol kinase, glycosomal [Leishmania major strain Friedlin]CAG9582662.1 glycerol_kinase_-_glycosomal_-_putative [Leishmania major strain Friedlin]CBZ12936.1 putative glycerol kinase, glycosomal [Leishmania major strain Friedlin]|eukprot:XP_003722702.1 putative glycerol kinase, glycosomal [Leishmania major strain Friedlin]